MTFDIRKIEMSNVKPDPIILEYATEIEKNTVLNLIFSVIRTARGFSPVVLQNHSWTNADGSTGYMNPATVTKHIKISDSDLNVLLFTLQNIRERAINEGIVTTRKMLEEPWPYEILSLETIHDCVANANEATEKDKADASAEKGTIECSTIFLSKLPSSMLRHLKD